MTQPMSDQTPWAVTMADIRAHYPCADGWTKLLKHTRLAPDDATTPVTLLTILDSNGLDDALWCLRAVKGHDHDILLYSVWCARQVQHLMTDPRSLAALDVAERYANGHATCGELAAAGDAARDAAGDAARDAARDAAWAAWAAGDAAWAAWAAARDAARVAARDAARVAARAAARDAARAAAGAAAGDAAWAAARVAAWAAQEAKFKEMVA